MFVNWSQEVIELYLWGVSSVFRWNFNIHAGKSLNFSVAFTRWRCPNIQFVWVAMLLLVSSALPQFNLSAIDIYDEHYKISSVWAVFKIKVYANILLIFYIVGWSGLGWAGLAGRERESLAACSTGVMWCNVIIITAQASPGRPATPLLGLARLNSNFEKVTGWADRQSIINISFSSLSFSSASIWKYREIMTRRELQLITHSTVK